MKEPFLILYTIKSSDDESNAARTKLQMTITEMGGVKLDESGYVIRAESSEYLEEKLGTIVAGVFDYYATRESDRLSIHPFAEGQHLIGNYASGLDWVPESDLD